MTDETTYGDVLARNIRAARSRKGLNQETLAARMRALGYTAWLRQTVANVEKGRRRATAEEILGLGYALETSIAALMKPTDDDKLVTFPSGRSIAAWWVQRSAAGFNDSAVEWNDDIPGFAGPREAALVELAAQGGGDWRRVNQTTGDVSYYDPATGNWVKRESGEPGPRGGE